MTDTAKILYLYEEGFEPRRKQQPDQIGPTLGLRMTELGTAVEAWNATVDEHVTAIAARAAAGAALYAAGVTCNQVGEAIYPDDPSKQHVVANWVIGWAQTLGVRVRGKGTKGNGGTPELWDALADACETEEIAAMVRADAKEEVFDAAAAAYAAGSNWVTVLAACDDPEFNNRSVADAAAERGVQSRPHGHRY